ncbi:MAG TPA: aminoacetone oxidase family FAD-binding enzyme, partial [Thermoanaerobaculia bacterium]|nr:aminoacetone oxidase family FAD-binding enzyme [Thermoanaerobaculia bacterium]
MVGAGAAGLMASIFAARSGARVVLLDSAKKIGAKILISGGGRCNVTHYAVSANDFNGNRNAIGKVLRTFDVPQTIEFFESIGVTLKREETGKLFPTTDRARTVLDALLRAAADVDVRVDHRVIAIESAAHFVVRTSRGIIESPRVILATGGRSIPKTGSDGFGYELVRNLGHTITPTFPALVPLLLPDAHELTQLSGTSVDAELAVRAPNGRVITRVRGAMLFTHFGISGPGVLDVSRHWIAAQPATLTANLLPGETFESIERAMLDEARRNPRATIASLLRGRLPERMLTTEVLSKLTKEERRRLVRNLVELPLPIVRDRGFDYAEVTAGGVPLDEIDLATMHSRKCDGLLLCG